jgi:hypothetical protein
VIISGLLSAATFVSAGVVSLREMPPVAEVPRPVTSLRLASKVAIDEALLAGVLLMQPPVRRQDLPRVARELGDALALFEASGWLDRPADYHQQPRALDAPRIEAGHFPAKSLPGGIGYQHLAFDSEYEPREGEPGRERWLGYRNNREAHAWVLRHPEAERRWLVCIHGAGMGYPLTDIGAFDPRGYHQRLGLNLLLPVLPLHGPRSIGRISGQASTGADVLNTVHMQAQAMWDIRRLVSWIRAQGGNAIGVFGISLGGYTAALLSVLEPRLACVIAGIPVTDPAGLCFGTNFSEADRLALESSNITEERMRRALRVVSPLVLEPQVPVERRAIFGGVADRIVPPDQVRALVSHWDEPRTCWYQGSHMTFMWDREVRALVRSTLDEAGLLG